MPAISPHHKAIEHYYDDLRTYAEQGVTHEGAIRTAFQSLLSTVGRESGWILLPELPLDNGRRPDGTLRDVNQYTRGYWEAKDTGDNLRIEVSKKIAQGYPTTNTIFEDSRQAMLYQGSVFVDTFDLTQPAHLADALSAFFTYEQPEIVEFTQAEADFSQRIPTLAARLKQLIAAERVGKRNRGFQLAYEAFHTLCQQSIDPRLDETAVDEMLVQHLMTERLFRKVFDNDDFTRRNAIAVEIEKVITALTAYALNRNEFLRPLDHFYQTIERAATGLADWSQKQAFLNHVYERFFQGYSVKQADTHGIVTTPQQIVDFMCASVDEVLQREFGLSLSSPGVQIIDPCTGTGTFLVNLIRRISLEHLQHKYEHDLFANEVLLLPYYIASLNIEHAYYERMGAKNYSQFDGLCFADTLELADRLAHKGLGEHSLWLSERNTERVEREQDAKIMVVIGNPPYNVGQGNENDNNKNRKYPVIDGRIADTYAKDSTATLKNKLYDAYVRFFRWATDRLQGRDGVVCFVSNNSFVHKDVFDGMRRHLAKDFTEIYHLDLGGDSREDGGGNVFGIRVGVGITVLVRNHLNTPDEAQARINFHEVPDDASGQTKLSFLKGETIYSVEEWQDIHPDGRNTWLTDGQQPEFQKFLPIGTKRAKSGRGAEVGGIAAEAIFQSYSLGVSTNRDSIAYNFHSDGLEAQVTQFFEDYNAEVSRWVRAGRPNGDGQVDKFVHYDRVKWSEHLKNELRREKYGTYDPRSVRTALYRPFCRRYLYYDNVLDDRPASFGVVLPQGCENNVIVVSDHGHRAPFSTIASALTPDLHLLASTDGFQCFPLFTYDEDGSNRRENITDWALATFQAAYGPQVKRRDIFDYVYAILHHPFYRERYAENLKRELPRIPLLPDRAAFQTCVDIGGKLASLHLNYEQAAEYPLERVMRQDMPPDYQVEKMRLTADKTALVYNDWLTLTGIPPACFEYRLGNRSALEWVIDQYQVSTDSRSGITSDPNRDDDPHYILRLVGRVITVSLKTVELVGQLAQSVSFGAVVPLADATPSTQIP